MLDWKGNDEIVCRAKVLNITNSIIVNCTDAIPLMKNLAKETNDTPIWEQYSEIQESKMNNHITQIAQLIIFRLEDFSGIFVIGCHFAVGSGISITKLLMELTDSVFIEPSCYSKMKHLKRTLGTIEDYAFSG
ncbi:MAG: hypothetical protein EZS28_036261 [Streblomastix strix]|uniref:Uncharacterized protein n=1 Tax=Streblomastix strix TaxID=222440 RepID=A0A5J4UE69_9EUKA|nr:MAG: hypothetical protein EZS28_036261 [Streblomastix strix]